MDFLLLSRTTRTTLISMLLTPQTASVCQHKSSVYKQSLSKLVDIDSEKKNSEKKSLIQEPNVSLSQSTGCVSFVLSDLFLANCPSNSSKTFLTSSMVIDL